MLINNLLEYSGNYFMTSGSLCDYYRTEINDDANENNAVDKSINNNKAIKVNFFNIRQN